MNNINTDVLPLLSPTGGGFIVVPSFPKKFKYKDDIKLAFDKEYSVRELLNMKDEKFAKI